MRDSHAALHAVAVERRRNFRVERLVRLRLRDAEEPAEAPAADPVAAYEELTHAAVRFRKEVGPAGRRFLDRLMETLDALTADAVTRGAGGGWTPSLLTPASLSASGIGFVADRNWAVGRAVQVEFALDGEPTAVPFRSGARVVRSEIEPDGRRHVGVEFTDMSAATRDRLIRVLFDAQRRDRRAERNGP